MSCLRGVDACASLFLESDSFACWWLQCDNYYPQFFIFGVALVFLVGLWLKLNVFSGAVEGTEDNVKKN